MIVNYGALLLCMFVGSSYSKRPSLGRFVGVTLSSSLSFFIITNFGTWLFQTMQPKLYTMDLAGLTQAFVMGIPFYKNSLASDMIFSAILFGGFEMAKVFIPKAKLAAA
jgi:hypothetical protein